MKELLLYLAKSLVDYPDDVVVTESEETGLKILTLSVNEDDMGKVIGKQGRIAKSIRNIVSASVGRSGGKVKVDIVQK